MVAVMVKNWLDAESRSRGESDKMPSDALDHPGVMATRSGGDGTVRAARRRFTIRNGVVNENSWPRIDAARVRDLGFIVADGKVFWFGVKRLESYRVGNAAPNIPAV